jgi:hypothetical protein
LPQDIKKSIFYFEKGAELGEMNCYNWLIFLEEEFNKEKNADKMLYYNRKLFESTKDEKNGLQIIKWLRLSRSTCWETSLHVFWSLSFDENSTLFYKSKHQKSVELLLLISKFRKDSKLSFVQKILVKGIIIGIIKYFCHFTQTLGK